jgi:RimJ/RimL family protein N-acetyltransferase
MPFPESFQTARLHAERLGPAHEADIHRMHQDPVQMAMLGGVRDAASTAEYMRTNLRHWDDYGFGIWLLRDGTGEVAGRALLRHLTMEGADEIEVGYSIMPRAWGQGLASEAAAACLEYGFRNLGFASIIAITPPDNTRSRRVMEKIGMTWERDVVHVDLPHVLYRASGPT